MIRVVLALLAVVCLAAPALCAESLEQLKLQLENTNLKIIILQRNRVDLEKLIAEQEAKQKVDKSKQEASKEQESSQ